MLAATHEQAALYLGPARVVVAAGRKVQVETPNDYVWAELALAMPYQPRTDDSVLVIGQQAGQQTGWYVIGVLKGTGPMNLTAPGDVVIAAPNGRIELTAGKGVRLRGPLVQLVADSLEVSAKSVLEKFAKATRWVKDVFQLRAGRVRTAVKTTYRVDAGRIQQNASSDVRIDGEKIHLG